MQFAERLQALMDHNGTTMYRLGKVVGVHQTTIKNWLESNTRPKSDQITTIANYFEVPVDYLIGNDETYELLRQAAKDKVLLDEIKAGKKNKPSDKGGQFEMLFSQLSEDNQKAIVDLMKRLKSSE